MRIEPVSKKDVRVGDMLAFYPRSQEAPIGPPKKDHLVLHRVIRLLRVGEQLVFLTQGDDQPMFDPVVLPDQIAGRAAPRRVWGVWVAQVSYLQAMVYHRWMCLRHRGIQKLKVFSRRSS